MDSETRRIEIEEELERVAKALPSMQYIKECSHKSYNNQDLNGNPQKRSILKLEVELPSQYTHWELMKKFMAQNGLPIMVVNPYKFIHEGIVLSSCMSLGDRRGKQYSLNLYKKGFTNLRERIELSMDCTVKPNEEVEWDFGLVKSITAYVNAYEESLKPKIEPKIEPKVEKKPKAISLPKKPKNEELEDEEEPRDNKKKKGNIIDIV